MLLNLIRNFVKECLADEWRYRFPNRFGCLARCHSIVDVVGIACSHRGNDLACARIYRIDGLSAPSITKLAIDEELVTEGVTLPGGHFGG